MADTVQYRLERMVDELDDLEKRGLFSRSEISEIVKQRRKYEYRLKRPSPLKQDYLTYIEYETQLDSLRRLRKKSVVRELKKSGYKKMKLSVSDFAGISRIVNIYRLAVTRFKGDVELWFRYLEFCRERRNGRMKKVLAQLIRFHPKVPGVWIYAAAWEFDYNLNVAAARALMQSGLRVCPSSEDLWIEYLRMELTYINKLKARKVALGEDTGSLVRDHDDDQQWKKENSDVFMSLDEERKNGDESNVNGDDHDDDQQQKEENSDVFMSIDEERKNVDESNVNGDDSEGKVDLFREHGLEFFQTIYSGAVEAIPASMSLRKRLFEILEATELAHSEDMRNRILNDMKRDFGKDAEYWDWLARLEMTDSRTKQEKSDSVIPLQLQKAIEVYEEAVQVVPSSAMFKLYAKFFMDALTPKGEENEFSGLHSHTEDYISRMLKIYETAETFGALSEDLACECVLFHSQLGRLDEARKLAETLCTGKLSDSVKLLLLRVSVEIRYFTKNIAEPSKADMDSVFELLRSVLTKAKLEEAEDLWVMAIKFFASEKRYFNKLVEIAFTSVAKYGGSDDGYSLPSSLTNCLLQKHGVQHAREMYKRFLALPRPGLVFYKNCIELEENLASLGDKTCLGNARKIYESALSTHDQNMSLWRNYYAMEVKLGTSETANAVHWRARKVLKNPAGFITSPDIL